MSGTQPDLASLVAYVRTLATLVEAGVSLMRCLALLDESTDDEALRAANHAVSEAVGNGATLSAAMTEQPAVFGPFLIGLVRAGEVGGVLQVTLGRAAEHYERLLQWRERERLYAAQAREADVVASLAAAQEASAESVALQHFCYAFATLLGSGVPILQALQVAGEMLPAAFAAWPEQARTALREQAQSLVPSMAPYAFPPVIVQLTALGEETGNLERTLVTAGDVLGYAIEGRLQRALRGG